MSAELVIGDDLINLAEPYVLSEAASDELARHHQRIKFVSSESIDITALTPEETIALTTDLTFYLRNLDLPLENLCSHLSNYLPANETQEELLASAWSLVRFSKRQTAAGLFIYGPPGIGKSHVAVGITKEFMLLNWNSFFIRPESHLAQQLALSHTQSLNTNQAWVLDDLNSPYGAGMSAFKKIALNAHDRGGRVFVTSNTSYEDLLKNGFAVDPDQRPRYLDRTKNTFQVLKVEGTSHRERTAWFST